MADVIGYNGSDKWKIKATELLNQGGGGGGGTTDYEDLSNKPQINSVELSGDLSASDLGFADVAMTGNYLDLSYLPSINGTSLIGNKTMDELFGDLYSISNNHFLMYSGDWDEATSQNPVYAVGFDKLGNQMYLTLKKKTDSVGACYMSVDDMTKLSQWLPNQFIDSDWDIKPMYNGAYMRIEMDAPVNGVDDTNGVYHAEIGTDGIKLFLHEGGMSSTICNVSLQNLASMYSIVSNLGTASKKDVPTSGNASSSQVVMGDDTRLTDARQASDVYSWAKASTKPTYTASEVGAIDATEKGASNGVAELDANGLVPSSQLPGFVDDVIEGYLYNGVFYEDAQHTEPITGNTGKIYVDIDTNKQYRWSGTAYVEISASLALGETSSTAYRGDRGKTAYDHATDANRLTTATASGLYKVESTAEGHIASLTAVQKSDITALGIASDDVATQSDDGLMSSTDKTKLDGIASGAEANVQSDWSQTTTTADDYIKNKPTTLSAFTDDISTDAATGSKLVKRTSGGYAYATYFNTSCTDQNPASYTSSAAFISSDGFLRKSSKANFLSWLGLGDSGNLTLNATYGAYYRKIGGMVMLRIDYRASVTSSKSVGTLPSGYRPPWQVMVASAINTQAGAYVTVNNNGTVTIDPVNGGGWCIACIAFVGT